MRQQRYLQPSSRLLVEGYICASVFSGGTFRLASYYGAHMVLQRAPEKSMVWGYGTTGAEVQFSLAGPQSEQMKSVPVLDGE